MIQIYIIEEKFIQRITGYQLYLLYLFDKNISILIVLTLKLCVLISI